MPSENITSLYHIANMAHWHITGGLNHLLYVLSISVSMEIIKDFSTNYMKALRLNQAYMLLKLRNNYYIVTDIS